MVYSEISRTSLQRYGESMKLFLNLPPVSSQTLATIAGASDLDIRSLALTLLNRSLMEVEVSQTLPPEVLEEIRYLQAKQGIERAERMGKVAKRRITILIRIEKIFAFYESMNVTPAEMTEVLASYVLEAATLEREAEAQVLVTRLLDDYEVKYLQKKHEAK
jgi:hypothetical protein